MILFRVTNGAAYPIEPGTAQPTDMGVLTAEQASMFCGKSADELRQMWLDAYGHAIPKTTVTGEPVSDDRPKPSVKPVKAWEDRSQQERDDLLRDCLYPHLTPEQFQTFKGTCQERRLSVYCRHLYPKLDTSGRADQLNIITRIDAMRLLADRTGRYEGQTDVTWAGADGVWVDTWTDRTTQPMWAKVGVYRNGFREAMVAKAQWDAYAPYTHVGGCPVLDPFWAKLGPMQLAKCAEALAFRKAFPEELAGILADVEMQKAQADEKERAKRKPKDGDDQRPDGDVAPPPAEADAPPEDPEVEEDEFKDLLHQLGGNPQATLANYRGIYIRLFRTDPVRFHRRVAADIREKLRQRGEAA